MGEVKDRLRVGKPALCGIGGEVFSRATVLDPTRFVKYEGRKLKGELIVNDEGIFVQGVRIVRIKKRLIRVPLVRWAEVQRIEICDHGYKPLKGGHTTSQSGLFVTTETEQMAYTLPVSPVALKNILGKIIVEVEHRSAVPALAGPSPTGSPMPPPPPPSVEPTPAGWRRDPTARHEMRYWDGCGWSEHVADSGVASIDRI